MVFAQTFESILGCMCHKNGDPHAMELRPEDSLHSRGFDGSDMLPLYLAILKIPFEHERIKMTSYF